MAMITKRGIDHGHTMAKRDIQLQLDIEKIIDDCIGVGNVLDELTLLRVSLRKYLDGMNPEDAVAWSSAQMSESLSKIPTK